MIKLMLEQRVFNVDGYSVIIKGLNKNRVTLLTDKGNYFDTDRSAVRRGIFKVRDIPSVCGVGYIGYGKYLSKENGTHTPAYQSWRDMIRRCYDKQSVSFSCYGGNHVTVYDKWHNFQNFAEWYHCQYKVKGMKYHLDKDFKGGLCYSEDTCILVPYYLNWSIVDTHKNTTKGFTIRGTKQHRLLVSCFGNQYQLPNHSINASLEYYNFFKIEVLTLVTRLSLISKHIDENIYKIVSEYCDKLQTGAISSSMLSASNKLISKILDNQDTYVKLGIDNGVEIINLYYQENLDRVLKWINQ